MFESIDEDAIYLILLVNPTGTYIHPSGKKLYMLTADQDDLFVVKAGFGKSFNKMTSSEINQHIMAALTK